MDKLGHGCLVRTVEMSEGCDGRGEQEADGVEGAVYALRYGLGAQGRVNKAGHRGKPAKSWLRVSQTVQWLLDRSRL